MKNEIQKLISLGDTEKALALLATKFPNDAALLQAQFANGKKEFNLNMMDYSDWQRIQSRVNYSILELSGKTEPVLPNHLKIEDFKSADGPKVFISYSWDDKPVALAVKKFLEQEGCIVTIDDEGMAAAQSISSFIKDSIRENHFIFSIVSKSSLSSGWVGQEVTASFFAEWLSDKQFIPVRLDNSFNDPRFFVTTLRDIEAKITELDDLIQETQKMRADTGPLDMDRKKLLDLKSRLPEILTRLKSINTVPIDGEQFEAGMKKAIARIKSPKP